LQTFRKTQTGFAGRGLTAAALAASMLLAAGATDVAQAQFFPWGGWEGPSSWNQRPRRQPRVRRYVEPKDEKPTAKLPKPEGALLLVVSLGRQTVTVYDGAKKIATSPISSGMRGLETPSGIFSLLEKNRYHYSNLYGGAPMPFMQRVTNSGVAMHAGVVPGHPASHGCIRLPYSFARSLFGITDVGARVVISDEDLSPKEFHSARLIAPLPPADLARNNAPERASATKEDFSKIVGVTPAEAATSDKPRTREVAAAQRAAQTQELAAAIKVAEAGKTNAKEHVQITGDLARKAKDEVHKARKEAKQLAYAARKAKRSAKAAEREFAGLMRKKSKVDIKTLDKEALEKESENELAEEAKVLDLWEAAKAAQRRADKQADAITKAVAAAEAAEKVRHTAVEDAKKAEQEVDDAKAALAAAETIEARKDYPVSIFVSGKTGRLIAKLGFERVINVPVKITDPDRPLGTHVFTATAFTEGEKALRWTVTTVKPPAEDSRPQTRRRRRRHADEEYVPRAGPDADPARALERIEIPQATRERLAELMKPGSSFIVSDYGLSRESSKRTEFIVEPWRARRHQENDADRRTD